MFYKVFGYLTATILCVIFKNLKQRLFPNVLCIITKTNHLMVTKATRKTECGAIQWETFIYLIERLKKEEKNYRFTLLIACGGFCGIRISDILSLTFQNLLIGESIELTEKKTGKTRTITINPSLRELAQFI